MEPRLLKPKAVAVRQYRLLTWNETKKVISAHKKKRMGIQEAAYDVEQVGENLYDVRMEYISK